MNDLFTRLPHEIFTHPLRAYAYYRNTRLDLLNGISVAFSLKKLEEHLTTFALNVDYKTPIVFHLSYEFGLYYNRLDLPSNIEESTPLALEIHYLKATRVSKQKLSASTPLPALTPVAPIPSYQEYKQAFKLGYEHLLNGDCYQFNLTFNHHFTIDHQSRVNDLIDQFFSNSKALAPFAHATSIPKLNLLLLSNSPESLFEISKCKLQTRPIKGSIHLHGHIDLQKAWQEMLASPKESSELNMITDLLRNDLTKIAHPYAYAKVLKHKARLLVPQIMHQYSIIEVELPSATTLGKVLENIFPGGSVTGAPKKSSMRILQKLEHSPRGFYTGSTIILHRKKIKASINIRTAVIDFKKNLLTYGAGGGITLLSKPQQEYQEMKLKVKSFIDLLNKI
ncbi:MAG: chorismate-binding protein [Oligoflexia bacterium]|nr:chorismate-binding protein [Oligoflexia bacterium]